MNFAEEFRKLTRRVLLGPPGLPGAFDLPLQSPQTEVAVWLHGVGAPRDVTACHSVACPIPCIFCIGFGEDVVEKLSIHKPLSLCFVERTGRQKLLGEIKLKYQQTIVTDGPQLGLYKATDCTFFCISPYRSWTRSLHAKYQHSKARHSGRLQPSSLDSCCNAVVFSCPRPVVLVSILNGETGNIFPMNLMGQVGEHHFVFALNRNNQAASAVIAAGQLCVSSIPFEHAEHVRNFGRHHHQSTVDFKELPFGLRPSSLLGIPVPDFALTVRELLVERVLPLGSHTFFIARIVNVQEYSKALEFYRIHGLYAAERMRHSS